jgi:carboxyl-terminal processing protease
MFKKIKLKKLDVCAADDAYVLFQLSTKWWWKNADHYGQRKNTLSYLHYSPKPINDAYSQDVYDKYFESVDASKRYSAVWYGRI